jgi:hypothetical protein
VLHLADEAEVLAVRADRGPDLQQAGVGAGDTRRRAPRRLDEPTTSGLTLPSSAMRTTSIIAASVTRRPPTKLDSTPSWSASELIWGPPPWTMTGLSPTKCSRATSAAKERLSSSSTIALPPYLMTTVWPWKRVIHGSASRRTAAFSWAA